MPRSCLRQEVTGFKIGRPTRDADLRRESSASKVHEWKRPLVHNCIMQLAQHDVCGAPGPKLRSIAPGALQNPQEPYWQS
jgi:hypothetical protein